MFLEILKSAIGKLGNFLNGQVHLADRRLAVFLVNSRESGQFPNFPIPKFQNL